MLALSRAAEASVKLGWLPLPLPPVRGMDDIV